MELNTLSPAPGSKKARRRVGRGIGSGLGKTSGRGHKGQKSRAGGFHKVGFEGGQMPLHRRLPKRGFKSHLKRVTAEVRLADLDRIEGEAVDLAALRKAGLVPARAERARIILSGKITKRFDVKDVVVTKGARAAIEALGGSVTIDPAIAAAAEARAAAAKARADKVAEAQARAGKADAEKAAAEKAAAEKAATKAAGGGKAKGEGKPKGEAKAKSAPKADSK